MTGMETLTYRFQGSRAVAPFTPVLVGVVASGNLEVLLEPAGAEASAGASTGAAAATTCAFTVETSARGFGAIWQAVLSDFQQRHGLAGVQVSIHDMGATPAVVSLRLDQAAASLAGMRP